REMVFGQDASFGDEALLGRYNADLANDLGNLVSRVTTMVHRYCDGVVPPSDPGAEGPAERELRSALDAVITDVKDSLIAFQLSPGLRAIWDVIGVTNRYIVGREPWRLAKEAGRRTDLEATLYAASDALRVIAVLIEPFMPDTSVRTLRML